MAEPAFLGIDIGTSSVKALLLQGERLVSARSRPYVTEAPAGGQARQDPRRWLDAVREAVTAVLSAQPAAGVDAIGLCGQMHALVPATGDGAPLGDALTWADQRAEREAHALERVLGAGYLRRVTGSPATPGYPAAKLMWMREHESERYQKARWFLGAKDWVRFVLGGTVATEPTDGSGTGLMDVSSAQWDPAIVQAVEVDPGKLPPILPSARVAGGVSPAWARELGVKAGTPLAAGAGDLPAALAFLGPDPGTLLVNLGSAGQVTQVLDPRTPVDESVQVLAHPHPDRRIAMAALLAAGLATGWLESLLAPGDGAVSAHDPVLFLPQLQGERTPTFDATPRGALVGLGLSTTGADLRAAVRDGILLQVRELSELMAGGRAPGRVLLAVEAAVGETWAERLASALGTRVHRVGWSSPSAHGAALIAQIAVGARGWSELDVAPLVPADPDPGAVPGFERRMRAYREVKAAVARAAAILAGTGMP